MGPGMGANMGQGMGATIWGNDTHLTESLLFTLA